MPILRLAPGGLLRHLAPRMPRVMGYSLLALLAQSQLCRAEPAVEATERANKLLDSAVEYYRTQGDAAFAAFSRQGEFIEGDRYVFVVDTHGTMLASGGPSAVLIGRNVSSVLAPELRSAFQQALSTQPDEGVRSTEYRWKNGADGRVERKRVYYQRVGERIIAVGEYLPRATPAQAQALLDKSVSAIGKDATASFKAINELSGQFREDDLYVFVVDLNTRRYVAHGYNLRLLGADFSTIHDPQGKPAGAPILALITKNAAAGYDYRWKNPVTSKVEDKHALLRKSGRYLVAVGYYLSPR